MNLTAIRNLIQIKNASLQHKDQIDMVFNKYTLELIKVLYHNGFIKSYTITKELKILIVLNQLYRISPTSTLKIISTPTKKLYITYRNICKIKSNKTLFCFSTTKGLMTIDNCKRHHIGGVLLFIC
jgi:ribosomal protein S8